MVILNAGTNTFEDFKIGKNQLVGLFVAEVIEDFLGLLAKVGIVRLQHVVDDLDELCGIAHDVEVDIISRLSTVIRYKT